MNAVLSCLCYIHKSSAFKRQFWVTIMSENLIILNFNRSVPIHLHNCTHINFLANFNSVFLAGVAFFSAMPNCLFFLCNRNHGMVGELLHIYRMCVRWPTEMSETCPCCRTSMVSRRRSLAVFGAHFNLSFSLVWRKGEKNIICCVPLICLDATWEYLSCNAFHFREAIAYRFRRGGTRKFISWLSTSEWNSEKHSVFPFWFAEHFPVQSLTTSVLFHYNS